MTRQRSCAALAAFVLSVAVAAPARAQSAEPQAPSAGTATATESAATTASSTSKNAVPTVGDLITGTLRGFQQLPSLQTMEWLLAGGVAAAATHPADNDTTRVVAGSKTLDRALKAGSLVGGTPFELGAALATYGLGRAFDNGGLATLGADLIHAQAMAETLTVGIKQATRRARPEGSGFSFPSGHTSAAFASATVLQQHGGWKLGVPAYAVATYVAASRIHDRRHYLSDVAFGAAVGVVSGRTATIGRSRGVALSVAPMPGGGAVVASIR